MNKRILATLLALALVLTLLPTAALAATPNLDAIAYVVGDRSACKMDATMANAYIKAIEQAREKMRSDKSALHDYDSRYDDICVALADFAGDGYPILVTVPLEVVRSNQVEWRVNAREDWDDGAPPLVVGTPILWGYRDGAAYDAEVPILWWGEGNYGVLDGQNVIKTNWSALVLDGGGEYEYEKYYTVSQGEITQIHDVHYFDYYDGEPGIPQGSVLSDGMWYYVTDMGKNVTQESMEANEYGYYYPSWPKGYDPIGSLFFGVVYGCNWCKVDTTPADQAIAALRGWAATPAVPTYKVTLRLDTGDVSVDAAQDQPMTVPQSPTKAGYTFGGWYLDAELTRPWNFNTVVTGDMELYGKWTPLTSTAATTGRSSQAITVNGTPVELEAYTLAADSNGGDVTFVKLRDVAAVLEGTEDQFNVEWKNGVIYVASKSAYTGKNGTELQPIVVNTTGYEQNTAPVLFDGYLKSLESIIITDAEGGGHTFFKLRDLADAIGFTVDWSAERGIYIETE